MCVCVVMGVVSMWGACEEEKRQAGQWPTVNYDYGCLRGPFLRGNIMGDFSFLPYIFLVA